MSISVDSDPEMMNMTKRQAHFQAFGYEPLRMKPAHFASGFFLALTGQSYVNQLLNKVAVIKANKGLLEGYAAEDVVEKLAVEDLIAETMTQADVELLRMQVNGVVNNDAAMYPAFPPYRPKGNDYTFISPRLLTNANRTDGFAGFFVFTVLGATDSGKDVLAFARDLATESSGTLERLVEPLLANDDPERQDLGEKYEEQFGQLTFARVRAIADDMRSDTDALCRMCTNLEDYSHYKKIRYYILGLLAWLTGYLLKTAVSGLPRDAPAVLRFPGRERQPYPHAEPSVLRASSRKCAAILHGICARQPVRSRSDRPRECSAEKNREEENDFRFLESHFGDLALRMGYAQPRASRVSQKHFELQPDTLRVLMLSILNGDAGSAITIDEVCEQLGRTWNIVIGGLKTDFEDLRDQGYFGFDEEDLRHNTIAFSEHLKRLNMAFEPSDGLVLCSKDIGEVL